MSTTMKVKGLERGIEFAIKDALAARGVDAGKAAAVAKAKVAEGVALAHKTVISSGAGKGVGAELAWDTAMSAVEAWAKDLPVD